MCQHLSIICFPLLDTSFRWEKVNHFRIIFVIIGIADMVELAPMLHNFAIELHIRQSLLSKFRIHQPLQVIKVTRHPKTSRLLLLELLIQKKGFLKECP